MQLVFLENNRPVTDSLAVAETFGKRHDDVLKSIRNLDCSKEFSLRNFAETPYKHPQNGQTYPKYLITQDGFSFLVMGYTGKESARFKEIYIGEFNRMRDELNKPAFTLPQNYVEALEALVSSEKDKQVLRAENERQGQILLQQRPMMIFAESLQVSKDTILIGELAKLLKQNGIEIGATRLFEKLRNDGYLHKSGSQYNLPTQKSMELGLMEIKVGSRSSLSEGTKITKTTKITGKGQFYFINKYRELKQEA